MSDVPSFARHGRTSSDERHDRTFAAKAEGVPKAKAGPAKFGTESSAHPARGSTVLLMLMSARENLGRMSSLRARAQAVGRWVLMLDLRERAVLFRDKSLWVTIHGMSAVCLLAVVAGPEGGVSRWEPFGYAVFINLFGRLVLWFNLRSGTKWRSWLYGREPRP